MQLYYRSEPSYDNKSLVISLAVHGTLLFILFFIVAWYPPNPPLGAGAPGIAINFGVDDYGMGDNNELPSVENNPVPVEQQEEPVDPTDATDASEVVTTEEETPYAVEKKEDKEVKKENKKVTETVKEPQDNKNTANTNVSNSPKVDNRNTMGNGDKNQAGDQGKTIGSLDSKNYYGNANSGNGGDGPGGNGSSLNMTGWRWSNAPRVNDASNESGKIVFKITVDEDGSILSVVPVERQVSAAVAKKYEDAVWKLEFEKTREFVKAAQNSTGYITFIIRSK